MDFDGFSINIFLDEEGDWIAHLVELPNISAFADSPDKALTELSQAWQAVKVTYKKHNQPIPIAPIRKQYKGMFNILIDKKVHKALAIEAARTGLSLNTLIAQKLAAAVSQKV